MPLSAESEKTLTQEQQAAFEKLEIAVKSCRPTKQTRKAVEMAKLHPDIALVEELWRVKCVIWDGRKIDAWTSKESVGDACRDAFGWEVTKEKDDWWYMYTMRLEDTPETEHFFEWICPPDPIPASIESFPEQTTGQDPLLKEARNKWKNCFVQKVLWWSIKLREQFMETNKTEKLEMGLLLEESRAKEDLLPALGDGDGNLPHVIRDWLDRSAKPRAAEGS